MEIEIVKKRIYHKYKNGHEFIVFGVCRLCGDEINKSDVYHDECARIERERELENKQRRLVNRYIKNATKS